jgi:hypothetical protein
MLSGRTDPGVRNYRTYGSELAVGWATAPPTIIGRFKGSIILCLLFIANTFLDFIEN